MENVVVRKNKLSLKNKGSSVRASIVTEGDFNKQSETISKPSEWSDKVLNETSKENNTYLKSLKSHGLFGDWEPLPTMAYDVVDAKLDSNEGKGIGATQPQLRRSNDCIPWAPLPKPCRACIGRQFVKAKLTSNCNEDVSKESRACQSEFFPRAESISNFQAQSRGLSSNSGIDKARYGQKRCPSPIERNNKKSRPESWSPETTRPQS